MNLVTLKEIKPYQVTQSLWEDVRDRVNDICAASHGRYEISDILVCLLNGGMQLWIAESEGKTQGIALSEIRLFPHLKELLIFAATGEDHELWDGLITKIEAWGRERGCHICKCISRPGWKKVLKDYGYEPTHIVLEKVIGYVH